jgi:hypothetical protein
MKKEKIFVYSSGTNIIYLGQFDLKKALGFFLQEIPVYSFLTKNHLRDLAPYFQARHKINLILMLKIHIFCI